MGGVYQHGDNGLVMVGLATVVIVGLGAVGSCVLGGYLAARWLPRGRGWFLPVYVLVGAGSALVQAILGLGGGLRAWLAVLAFTTWGFCAELFAAREVASRHGEDA